MRRAVLWVFLYLSAGVGYAAEMPLSAGSLVGMMQQARYSAGFEARMNVFVRKSDGALLAPVKLAVIGQSTPERQRLLIRGIAPEILHGRFYAIEHKRDGGIRVVGAREVAEFAPYARIFDSALRAGDMLAPWWDWPRQSLEGREQINGRECLIARSFTDEQSSAVREVESCVDQNAKLALRTRLYDGRHMLLRTLTVDAVMQNGGRLMAKKLSISEGKAVTRIEIYAGDQEYEIGAETFSVLDRLMHNEQQR